MVREYTCTAVLDIADRNAVLAAYKVCGEKVGAVRGKIWGV